ncbi:MAG: hypothetical protein Q8O52_09870 [Sulfuritalea sp.]|nr:hypothetical protein [Sulfuritalea sp.]
MSTIMRVDDSATMPPSSSNILTTESQQRPEAKAAGASGWLVKPATTDELPGTTKRVIR